MKKNSEYEKMPQSLQAFGFDEKAVQEIGKLNWVVTEKIHGANFSFVYEHPKLLFAKRKEYLSWNDDFFGFQEVVVRLENQILQLFEQISLDIQADRYIVYGELFGGKYPHPHVTPSPHVEAIQTGVFYSPTIEFCAFDIALETQGVKQYLDYERALVYFEKFELLHAKPLFTGKINEALNFDLRISSTLPHLLQLPEIENNLIEGVVIKPLKHSGLKSVIIRPIIKIKNPEFNEDGKFHEAEKWSFIPKFVSNSEELSFLMEEISPYINQNRLQSAISKIGKLDFENQQRIQDINKEILEDIWTDFNIHHQNILNDLAIEKQDWIRERIKAHIQKYLIDYKT
ncbi:MAG: 2'-5' RNA ligase [Raineya sp.]|nr:2'-5' RNA ligase [Raineya sp.]